MDFLTYIAQPDLSGITGTFYDAARAVIGTAFALTEVAATPGWYGATPARPAGASRVLVSSAGDAFVPYWEDLPTSSGDTFALIGAAGAGLTAVGLAPTERAGMAAAVEAALLNEADGKQVIQAIVDKINATDTNLAGLSINAIAQAVRDVALAGAATGSLGATLASASAAAQDARTGVTTLSNRTDPTAALGTLQATTESVRTEVLKVPRAGQANTYTSTEGAATVTIS